MAMRLLMAPWMRSRSRVMVPWMRSGWRSMAPRMSPRPAIESMTPRTVGIYGYVAYSASKFALRGLGEALQHEVIKDNIHVSIIFPPKTETPGFLDVLKGRPELTGIIAGSSSGMKADGVAKKALDGIKSGKFIIPCNFEGTMLAVATAGLSTQSSPIMAFVEVTTAGLMRFSALCYQWSWFSTIENYYAKNRKHE
ncbi:3-dehydrosphinganine reductase TSC10A [Dichanthelium oligosanthes]|uniref:3-dehydrosphinganine reductase TSC10A n=1 Tax=Dichanthelium oligosanthes TaxID=888268 RepID=A0A1E5W6T1_9POAL|nr:3-dehydrosphinganine reductase TSC10A [Dichanthelium oligosanthes]